MAMSDTERNYAEGNWGKGKHDAAALAEMYGLDRSQEGRGEGHIWGRGADGNEVYIGKSSMDLASNDSLIKSHALQASDGEIKHSDVPDALSSFGDIKGAILNQWNAGDGDAKPAGPAKDETIFYSDKAAQAKAGEKTYEDVVLPHMGDYITGRNGKTDVAQDYLNEYKLNLTDFKKERNVDGSLYEPNKEEALVAGAVTPSANGFETLAQQTTELAWFL